MEGSVEVPSFFLCPISLQIMRDPVTLSTGITYDRQNIEHWVFTLKRDTCPLTKQPLDSDLTAPNITLRRLIQAWCALNSSSEGIERFPTPRPPVTRAHVADLIEDATSGSDHHSLLQSLRKIKGIVSESDRNRQIVESSSGAVEFLASVIAKNRESFLILDEALNTMYSLHISESGLIELLEKKQDFVDALTSILQQSNYQCRAYSTLLLKRIVSVLPSSKLMSLKRDFFVEIVRVLKDRISYQSTKAASQILAAATHFGRNKIKTVEAGGVTVLIEHLLDETEKKGVEMMLAVLSRLAECAEGRAEIVGHAAGIAVVARKLVRVSVAASERAVRVVYWIAKCSPTAAVLKEMMEIGVVSKLCLLVQVECGLKTKERVKEMLRMHARVWRNSPCVSPQLQSSYPD